MAAMAARAIWKGSISFGLVNIPIQVFSATQKEDYTSFSQLCDKRHKIKYKKWCPVEEREVPWSEIKRKRALGWIKSVSKRSRDAPTKVLRRNKTDG
jgi:non-homologous end joining protein Ku